MRRLLTKYRELLLYGIVGLGTTVINFGSYYILTNLWGVHYLQADIAAWILGFVFAFSANKTLVFGSRSWSPKLLLKEIWLFFLSRAATGVLDVGLLYLLVDCAGMNHLWAKIFDIGITTIINYFTGKFIFKNQDSGEQHTAASERSVNDNKRAGKIF